MNQRGIFEKTLGSSEWWIRYADASARIRMKRKYQHCGCWRCERSRWQDLWRPKEII